MRGFCNGVGACILVAALLFLGNSYMHAIAYNAVSPAIWPVAGEQVAPSNDKDSDGIYSSDDDAEYWTKQNNKKLFDKCLKRGVRPIICHQRYE
jgi:hypothetical protein